jgi:hypothetical protein
LQSYLFQDLSPIPPDRPQLAFEWVLDFVDRASVPQSSSWDRKTLVKFGQDLRASRANSRLGREAGLNDAQINQFFISFPDVDKLEKASNPKGSDMTGKHAETFVPSRRTM